MASQATGLYVGLWLQHKGPVDVWEMQIISWCYHYCWSMFHSISCVCRYLRYAIIILIKLFIKARRYYVIHNKVPVQASVRCLLFQCHPPMVIVHDFRRHSCRSQRVGMCVIMVEGLFTKYFSSQYHNSNAMEIHIVTIRLLAMRSLQIFAQHNCRVMSINL